jgi:transcriptional regulator with PAS, ATPase and Fis domain
MIGLLSNQDVTVLITGESGVGKELVARAIHNSGSRCNEPFIAVNCGAVPDNLIEAEIFGFEKGAFTGADRQKRGKFEAAGNGTIFLDEIAELHMSLQVKLLRVLQEQSFDRIGGNVSITTNARIIAASNRDLLLETKNNRFRKDLFYRLHLVNIQIPPLRERKEDIPPLVDHFINKSNIEMGRSVRGVTDEAMSKLVSWLWPGNVRELENLIKRAMVLCRDDVLPEYLFEIDNLLLSENENPDEEDIISAIRQYFSGHNNNELKGRIYESATGIVEKTLIQEALAETSGNQMRAARLLGMNRSTLRKKIKDYSL